MEAGCLILIRIKSHYDTSIGCSYYLVRMSNYTIKSQEVIHLGNHHKINLIGYNLPNNKKRYKKDMLDNKWIEIFNIKHGNFCFSKYINVYISLGTNLIQTT